MDTMDGFFDGFFDNSIKQRTIRNVIGGL